MQSAIWSVTQIDSYTAQVERSLERFYAAEYPQIQLEALRHPTPGTCQMTYARTDNQADDCYSKAFVSDLNTGTAMCRNCARMNVPEILTAGRL
jgi:hypothetical protein